MHPYLYPPSTLLLFFPLSLFSYDHARIIILALNHVTIVFFLWLLFIQIMKLTPKNNTIEIILSLFYILSFYPLVVLLNHGQVNLFMACCLLIFWISLRSNKSFLASIFLVIAVLLKTYPIILIPFLLITKRYKTIKYFILLLVGIIAISYLLLPPQIWQDWLTNVVPTGGYGNTPKDLFSPAAIWNQSFNGFFSRLFSISRWSPNPLIESVILAKAFTYFTSAGLFLISLYAVYVRNNKTPESVIDWMMLIFLPFMFLISPLSWEHHLVYILPSIIILVMSIIQGKVKFISVSALILLSAFIIGMKGLLEIKLFAVMGVWCISVFLALTNTKLFTSKKFIS